MTAPLLYLAHRVPYPPDKGDRIRNWNVLRFLARRRPVDPAPAADEPVPDETRRVLEATCERVAIVPVGGGRWISALGSLARGGSISEGAFSSSELRRILDEWAKATSFGVAVVSASSLVPYLRRPNLRQVPAIVDLVDVDSQKWFDYAAASSFPKSLLYRLEGSRLRRLERELPTWTRAVMVVSAAETDLYRQFAAPGNVMTVTNGVDLDYFQPRESELDDACTFVGALDYRPNIDGACWFAEAVWPELHRLRPELKFRIVGRSPSPAVRKLADVPGIEVIGGVPDVRPWVAKSAVIVVPLRIARGVQNKVLEALALAKACVAAPSALAGLRARPNEEVLAATTPSEWIDAVTRLLADASLRERLGTTGRKYVEAHHTWDECLRALGKIVAQF